MADEHQDYVRGPGRSEYNRDPVLKAYAETGAGAYPCTAEGGCGVAINDLCVHPDGTPRKIPCPSRMPHNPDTGGDDA